VLFRTELADVELTLLFIQQKLLWYRTVDQGRFQNLNYLVCMFLHLGHLQEHCVSLLCHCITLEISLIYKYSLLERTT